eukprot:PITA_02468
MKYSYVEKLALVAVQVIERFRHYVLFRKTTILSDCNPMTYILSRQLLGGKYSKWIAILQEFDLESKESPGYFWPTTFKDCITAVRSFHACQIFDSKTRRPPALLQLVVAVRPFTKWGIDFMTFNPTSAGGHGYIIVAVDYFTKWAEAMPTLNNSGEMAALFIFNHVVSRFGIPQAIVTDHGSLFRNHMMVELPAKLGLSHDSSTPYYPQANG